MFNIVSRYAHTNAAYNVHLRVHMDNLNNTSFQYLDQREIKTEKEMNQDIKPAVVPPALRLFYEIMHELNDSCQLDLTLTEVINFVNYLDIVPDICEHKSCIFDPNGEFNAIDYSINSIQQGSFGNDGKISRGDACPKTLPKNQCKRSSSSSSSSRIALSRSIFVNTKLSRVVIKLTSREYLAFRHYNNAKRCIEKLNICLFTKNVKGSFSSSKKSRLTVKGTCVIDLHSLIMLKLIRLAVRFWDQRKTEKYSQSIQNPEDLDKFSSTANRSVNFAENHGLVDNIKASGCDNIQERGHSSVNGKQAENLNNLNTLPTNLSLPKLCLHLCKDFPDCSNTSPDEIISNSCCEVVYIVKPSQHNLFVRADQQFHIVDKLNFRFEGVKISLLRKFAAFHVLPSKGGDPQFAINAINQLKRRCFSMGDILQDENFKDRLYASNLDAPSTSCLVNADLKPSKKPRSNLNSKSRRPSREFCRRKASKSSIKGRERNDWRSQSQQQQKWKNQEQARESYSAQRFDHYDSLEYLNSYYEDKGAIEYARPSHSEEHSFFHSVPAYFLITLQENHSV